MIEGKVDPRRRMAREGAAARTPFPLVETPAASALSAISGVSIPLLMPITATDQMIMARLQLAGMERERAGMT
jgi:hypothetical protein